MTGSLTRHNYWMNRLKSIVTLGILVSCLKAHTFTKNNGFYISVYNNATAYNYNWYESKDYCMINYGSSLASIHSSTDFTNLNNSRANAKWSGWIGLNDVKDESEWEWSDGTLYDYDVNWAPTEPNDQTYYNPDGQDCVHLYGWDHLYEYEFDDRSCYGSQYSRIPQFFCEVSEQWRPIFKISSNNSNLTGESNVYKYWLNGSANFDNFLDDNEYVTNDFIDYKIDLKANYRSFIIDHWTDYVNNNNNVTKIKVSIYKDGEQVSYWVFNISDVNINQTDWFAKKKIH